MTKDEIDRIARDAIRASLEPTPENDMVLTLIAESIHADEILTRVREIKREEALR